MARPLLVHPHSYNTITTNSHSSNNSSNNSTSNNNKIELKTLHVCVFSHSFYAPSVSLTHTLACLKESNS